MIQLELFQKPSKQEIIHADCLETMRAMADNSIDCIVTDPPYGLSFMGKNWDGRVPGMEYWQEALRICKPGAHLLSFGGSRTHHHLMVSLEGAGWEIRDVIMWLYGQGFPKSHNHFGLEGYGTSLKPAYEPIIMCMKPCDGTFKNNAEKWGVAGINIDACRIGTEIIKTNKKEKGSSFTHLGSGEGYNGCKESYHKGRWPSNIILDELSAEMLDKQSGILKSGLLKPHKSTCDMKEKCWGFSKERNYTSPSNSGGASRFFYCAKASPSERNKGLEGFEDIQIKRLSGGEYKTNSGSQKSSKSGATSKNIHPTVKPLKLMEYLLKLVMPPSSDAVVLDPFCGSGTTILAAKNLGFNAIGIEKEKDYAEIAKKRIGE